MGFLKKDSRGQGFKGSSENNETLRQAQGDKKKWPRIRGVKGYQQKRISAEIDIEMLILGRFIRVTSAY